MEINIQSLAHGKDNRYIARLSTVVTAKPYHGFHCGVGRIIERRAACDKRSKAGKIQSLRQG
jgi:hypothetical protein